MKFLLLQNPDEEPATEFFLLFSGTYLEKSVSTLQSCRAEGSNWAECTPEMDTGQQGAWCQQNRRL